MSGRDGFQNSSRPLYFFTVSSRNEEDGQWPMPAKNYASTRFSGLDEINAGNVQNLKVAWTFSLGVNRGQEAAPIVVGDTRRRRLLRHDGRLVQGRGRAARTGGQASVVVQGRVGDHRPARHIPRAGRQAVRRGSVGRRRLVGRNRLRGPRPARRHRRARLRERGQRPAAVHDGGMEEGTRMRRMRRISTDWLCPQSTRKHLNDIFNPKSVTWIKDLALTFRVSRLLGDFAGKASRAGLDTPPRMQ